MLIMMVVLMGCAAFSFLRSYRSSSLRDPPLFWDLFSILWQILESKLNRETPSWRLKNPKEARRITQEAKHAMCKPRSPAKVDKSEGSGWEGHADPVAKQWGRLE